MAEQFKDQGGVASMDPSPFYRWLTSRIVRRICSPQRQRRQQATASEWQELAIIVDTQIDFVSAHQPPLIRQRLRPVNIIQRD